MLLPMAGLESILADASCQRVELQNTSSGAAQVFLREGEDHWVADDEQSDALHTKALWDRIQKEFGRAYDRLVCMLPEEKVEYVTEGSSVRIRRLPRSEPGADSDAAGAGLTVIADALGIPRSKRKAKFRQAYQFARMVQDALPDAGKGSLGVLDLACGRSYLGFVLVHLLAAGGRSVRLHGVDSERSLVEKCREIATTLQWTNSTFEMADIADYSLKPNDYDVAVSLHGCDTLTDEAIRIACRARIPLLFVAPCCQHEFRHQLKSHPLDWLSRYGLLEQRLADVLTDGFRCLVMEALGYRVKVLRFTEPDVTPKNLLIQARLTSEPRPGRAREARAFLRRFGLRPALAALLDAGDR
ncbi:MAG: class I SAM-dependent methyltransferase [Planctomycetota bacterium]|jgi:SAM-dependent methyltransferase